MRKDLIILIFSLLYLTMYAQSDRYAQYYFKNIPQAPSTSTFLRYGDIQNSEYIGSNSPEITLLGIESNNIKLPLTLKYISGNGVKVTDESGSYGLGWDMNLPTITQSVLGYDDLSMGIGGDKLKLDFMYPSPYDGYLPHQCSIFTNTSNPGVGTYSYYKSVDRFLPFGKRFAQYMGNEGIPIDGSPDVYNLNLFGEKIVFTISNFPTKNGQDGNECLVYGGLTDTFTPIFSVLNKKGYKIQYSNLTFIIVDPSGTKYFFNQREDIKNSSANIINRNFVVNQIQDRNGNSIYLQYKNTDNVNNIPFYSRNLNFSYGYSTGTANLPIASTTGAFQFSQEFDFIYYNNIGGQQSLNPLFTNSADGYTHSTGLLYGTSQNYLNVEKIYGDFGIVDFHYSNRNDHPSVKLDRIELKNFNQVIKTINFSYDYFLAENNSKIINSNYDPVSGAYYDNLPTDRLTKKLKLILIKINDNYYRFSYFNTQIAPKNSFAQDYWGYPNGANNNVSLFPNPQDFLYPVSMPLMIGVNNNIKSSNESFVTAGLLETIYYPTGGYSKFKYELNEANNLFNGFDQSVIIKGKGVRLKEQVNYDNNNAIASVDKFTYYDGRDSNPLYLFNRNRYRTLNVSPANYTGTYTEYNIINTNSQNTNSASPLSSGNYVGYSQVVKQKFDFITSQNSGKVITQFSNIADFHYENLLNRIPLSMPSTQGSGEINGKPLIMSIYDKNNVLIKKTENLYSNEYYNVQYGSSYTLNSRYVINTNQNNGGQPMEVFPHSISLIGFFPILYKESLLSNSRTTEYINNQSVVANQNYYYNNNNQLISKSTTFPDGKYNSENFKYSTEKNNVKLIDANILNFPLETQVIGNVINGSLKTTSLHELKFDDVNHLNPTSALSYNISDVNNNPQIEVTYDQYDSKGNLLQYTTKDAIPTAIVWGYNQNQPIAKITGATYTQVSNLAIAIIAASDLDASNPANEAALLIALDSFRKLPEFQNAQITTYTYDPLIGVTSITPPSGMREDYKYDSQNRLEKVVDVNGKIIKEYNYNYAPTRYYNIQKSQIFTRNNCSSNSNSGNYIYMVPANQYSSTISQADADQKALNDISANGQNAANINGTCTPFSCNLYFNYSLGISGGGSVSATPNSYYKVSFGFSSGPNSTTLPWTTGVKIATIDGICKPTRDYSSYNGQVYYTIKTNGDVILKRHTGSSTPNNTSYNYEFFFPIN